MRAVLLSILTTIMILLTIQSCAFGRRNGGDNGGAAYDTLGQGTRSTTETIIERDTIMRDTTFSHDTLIRRDTTVSIDTTSGIDTLRDDRGRDAGGWPDTTGKDSPADTAMAPDREWPLE